MADRAARRAERERIKAKRAQYVWVRAGNPHRLGVAIDTPTLSAQRLEQQFNRSRKCGGIETANSDQQINAIVVGVSQAEDR